MEGSRRGAWLSGSVAVLVATLAVFLTAFERVPLDRVGVRLHKLGAGIEKRDLTPGYYLVLPGVHELLLFSPAVQDLTMEHEEAIRLRGKDEYQTAVDITVFYRIQAGEAHLLAEATPTPSQWQQVLRQGAENTIWEVLGELSTEDFYDTDRRMAAAQKARERMNADLAKNHLVVEDVLIRNIAYDPRFEERLLEQQLLGQKQILYASQQRMEEELEKTQTYEKGTGAQVLAVQEQKDQGIKSLIADMDRQVAEIEADANYRVQTLVAEAEAYRRGRIAQGELLRVQAQAEGEQAINEAYAGRGGELLLARQIIQNLSLGEIEVNTNRVNPFDVEAMLEMVGAAPRRP
ncbi:MAG: SPFH domain-containing protein [Planctomycetes bacterium]|nr:SPFH domain-containing protein [Planctomycetota bacterium]